jgi:hypothetical protein
VPGTFLGKTGLVLPIEWRICSESSVNESSLSMATVAVGEEVSMSAVLLLTIHDCAAVVLRGNKLRKISESMNMLIPVIQSWD